MVFRAANKQRSVRREGGFAPPPPQSPVRRFIGNSIDTSRFGAVRTGRSKQTPVEREIVPGPLGTWERQKSRPNQQIGKFGATLMGTQGAGQPGAPTPYTQNFQNPTPRGSAASTLRSWADPANPENGGFFEGLLGGLFGLTGNEAVRGFGRFLGSGVDVPFEAVGNVAGLPGMALSAAPMWQRDGGLNPDIKAMYDEASRENPLNALLLYGHAAKAQWNRDVEQGRMTGLLADVGPAVAVTDQLGLIMTAVFGGATRGVQRTFGSGGAMESAKTVERATASGQQVLNPAWQRVQQRLERGDFGVPGTQQARDKMIDSLIVEGSLLRDPGDREQDGFITGQGLADIAFSLVTDPTIIASFGVGALAKGAQMGRLAANAKFWQAVPEVLRTDAVADVGRAAMRIGKFDSTERAWAEMGKRSKGFLETQALREVAQMPKYADAGKEMLGAANYLERWRTAWEPALRPITSTVRNINDPLRIFGIGTPGKVADTIYASNASEGAIRGAGSLDAHLHVTDSLNALPNRVGAEYTRGIGVYTANLARAFVRNGMVKDIRARGGVPFRHTPDEVMNAKLAGTKGSDVATGLEKLALRVRPLYLATKRGGREEAIERGRTEVATRLHLMGASNDEALSTVANMGVDELSLMDAAYFGWTTDAFVKAKAMAVADRASLPKGAVDPDRLTILGPRQMTMQTAQDTLDAATRGDIGTVREALGTYDILFENLSEGMSDTDLIRVVRELLDDQIAAKAFPVDLPNLNGLSAGMREWAETNADLGYRPGFRPDDDQLWRVSVDADGNIIGVNPWTELGATASDVASHTRFSNARDYLFHNVRGERIMADARVRMAEYTTERFGFTRSQSDAMFARVIRLAQESGITPRGMSPEQVYGLFKTARLDEETMSGIGVREAIEAVMTAFEGKFRHVGLTQKFTGGAKSHLGGQGNWLGQVAERVYPMVRFTLNPLFQMQELTEPFILNVMRGIKPGFTATDMDERTLSLIENLIRDSKYAMDDQIERSNVLLWGADSAKAAFGSETRLGRLVSKIGFLNVKEIKRVNYARATRRQLGVEFESAVGEVMPSLIPTLKAFYATDDVSEVAVRYLSEKAQWGSGARAQQDAIKDALKPSALGARTPVNMAGLPAFFDDIPDELALRRALRDGSLTPEDFNAALREAGADPDYAVRAYTTASARFTGDEFWDHFQRTLGMDNATRTGKVRAMVKARAEVLGVSEDEWLARTFADVPMSADSRALAAADPSEMRSLQLMMDAADAVEPRAGLDAAMQRFRETTRFADREHFAILEADGTVVREGEQAGPWTQEPNGSHSNAGMSAELGDLDDLKGRIFVHSHPSQNPFSPADITSSIRYGVTEMWVVGPGVTHVLKPAAGGDWMDSISAMIGTPPPRATGGELFTDLDGNFDEFVEPDYYAEAEFWAEAYQHVAATWRGAAQKWYREVAESRYFSGQMGDESFKLLTDGVATSVAVQAMADRYGWVFDTVRDYSLPVDVAARQRTLTAFAENPPWFRQRWAPEAYRSAPLERSDLRSGTSVAFEYDTSVVDWLPRNLSDDQQRAVMNDMEGWLRTDLAPRYGVMVTDVRNARGGWFNVGEGLFTDTVNTVQDVFGSRQQVAAYAAAVGKSLKQYAVFTSRPKIGREVADAAQNEAWSWQFVAARALSDDEATALQRKIAQADPEIGGMGSSIVTLADGRTAVRFVDSGNTGIEDRLAFQTRHPLTSKHESIVDGLDYDVEARADVMDTIRIENNWDEAPNGETYDQTLRQYSAGVEGELGADDARQAQDRLAASLRLHAPNEFADHLDGLVRDGRAIPDFGVPGEFTPTPVADRVTVFIPGGRGRVLTSQQEFGFGSGVNDFTLWEQQVIKAQRIDPAAAYNADPTLYLGMMKAVWGSKWKSLEQPSEVYNSFAWAALTANAALDVTEGAFPLVRAQMGTKSLRDVRNRMTPVWSRLPSAYRDDARALGVAFQLEQGLRFTRRDIERIPGLRPEEAARLDRLSERIDRRMVTLPAEDRQRWADRIQARLDRAPRAPGEQRSSLMVHPFRTGGAQAGGWGPDSFVSIGNPNARMRAANTSVTWGRIVKWIKDGVFDSDNPAVQRFMKQQPNESRTSFAMRVGSILPGIDMKTGLLAMEGAGPHLVDHGALDTHMLRFITNMAIKRGELEDLLGRVSPAYANHLRKEAMSEGRGAFKSPRGARVNLVSGKRLKEEWSGEKLAHMRSRLHLIPDPETRLLYDDPEVLRLVSETDGKVNSWGGDYAAVEDYFNTTLRADEVTRLRTAGFDDAADMVEGLSGAQWQWLMWDRIRSTDGLKLDPHVSLSKGADHLPPRTALELDQAIGIGRSKGPYDPEHSLLLQQMDGNIMGANVILADERRLLLATQHADARTGMHEMVHSFEKDLDPSQREVILTAFRGASGSRRTTWNRDVSEWFVDEMLGYVRTAKAPDPSLRSAFEYFRKTIAGVEATIKQRQGADVMTRARTTAITRATKQVAKAGPAAKEAARPLGQAQRELEQARKALRAARARTGLDVLEGRWSEARDAVDNLVETQKELKERIRVLTGEAKAARLRAQGASGTRSAGGFTVGAQRKEAQILAARETLAESEAVLAKARKAQRESAATLRGARRRTPLATAQATKDAAEKAHDAAAAAFRRADTAAKQAAKALADAKAMPQRPPKGKIVVPPASPEMQGLFDSILRPPVDLNPKTGVGSPVDIGTAYNLQEEAAYTAASHALSRAEENAFTLHYYKRGRSFVERSINHPYFGLYPASYMWGKVLPELLRFLIKTPFGIDAPLGGLALSNNIYRQVMVQQNYDMDFREQMVERSELFHLLALMTPSLPWEVPVNAPLWTRRVAEADEQHQAKLAAGDLEAPLMNVETFGELTKEMLGYAFGPANAIETLASGFGSATSFGSESLNMATSQIEGLLNAGSALPDPVAEPAPVQGPVIALPQFGPTQ